MNKGQNLNFNEMSATRNALDFYKMRGRIEKLKIMKNFLHTEVWPEYAHVIEFFESGHSIGALTDSGGIQEELNLIGKACFTCRMSTDRPETVFDAKCNVLVPPISSDYMMKVLSHLAKNESLIKKMGKSKKLYGSNVGSKVASIISKLIKKGERPFKWSHEALGLWKEKSNGVDYL